jgi:hypothetical protein
MPHLFTCPNCHTKTLVDDQYSGHVGRCVTCDQPIQVPVFLASSQNLGPVGLAKSETLRPTVRRFLASIICVVLLAGLAGVVYRYGQPTLSKLTSSRERAAAISNLKQIAAALNAYAADHGSYPLPIVRDANGQAMHSWRVAILPYLNEHQLANKYDFGKPWNSRENMVLVESIPSVYVSTSQPSMFRYSCDYQLVVGDRTLFPKAGPLNPKRVSDDVTKTALLVEATSRLNLSNVWTEPIELDIQAMTGAIGSNPGIEVGSVTEGGVAIATVDGEGHFLDESMAPAVVLAILTASGNEPLADDVLD